MVNPRGSFDQDPDSAVVSNEIKLAFSKKGSSYRKCNEYINTEFETNLTALVSMVHTSMRFIKCNITKKGKYCNDYKIN